MGILDIFKRRNKRKEVVEEIVTEDSIDENNNKQDDFIEQIKEKYKMFSLSNILKEKLENNPELIDILLNKDVSNYIIYKLEAERVDIFPIDEEEIKYSKYINYNEDIKKKLNIIDNSIKDINEENYISCYIDINKEVEMFENKIKSFIPNIDLIIDKQLLTPLESYSSYKILLSKDKYKKITHNFREYIVGNIEFNKDIIIKIPPYSLENLESDIVDKISKCNVNICNNEYISDSIQSNEEKEEKKYNYKLIKYNHLIYVFENSFLDEEIKNKLIYDIKNLYFKSYFDIEVEKLISKYIHIIGYDEINSLTNKYIENINLYKDKEIELPEFNVKYYIEDNLSNLNNMTKDDLIYFLNRENDEVRKLLFKDKRVLEKIGLSEDTPVEKINEILFLFNERLPIIVEEFVKSLNFDIKKFMTNPDNNFKSLYGINYIEAKFGIRDSIDEEKEICVEDLIGTSYNPNDHEKNILHTFNSFYQQDGDGYHTRALELLEYQTGTELLEAFKRRGNDTKDMNVIEIENGKYVISTNGLHRFTVLRFHYLLDKMKGEKSEEELRELYTIPVNLEGKINYKKTYCNYLIRLLSKDISFISFCGDKISLLYKDNNEKEITEDQLLFLAKEYCNNIEGYNLYQITKYYDEIDSFKEFVNTNIPSLVSIINNKEESIDNDRYL